TEGADSPGEVTTQTQVAVELLDRVRERRQTYLEAKAAYENPPEGMTTEQWQAVMDASSAVSDPGATAEEMEQASERLKDPEIAEGLSGAHIPEGYAQKARAYAAAKRNGGFEGLVE